MQYLNKVFIEVVPPDLVGVAMLSTSLFLVTTMYGVIKLHDRLNLSLLVESLVASATAVYGFNLIFRKTLQLPRVSFDMIKSHLHGRNVLGQESTKFFLASRPIYVYLSFIPVKNRNIFLVVMSDIIANFLIQLLVSY